MQYAFEWQTSACIYIGEQKETVRITEPFTAVTETKLNLHAVVKVIP